MLKADNGQLPTDQAQKLVTAVRDAIAKASAAAHTVLATTTTVAVPVTKFAAVGKAPAAKDLKGDALAALQKATDTLLAAITSGDASKVVPAVTGMVTGLVNYLAATLLAGGLPAANLPGLPGLPLPLRVG
ncbi:hypothetical protein [Streptomyces sp. NPDC047043]|uniref:hypothetical protein n=1 Tax=Streptomyces sp. NPDC047043 TaxID=3154497 RepID=UPI0033D00B77